MESRDRDLLVLLFSPVLARRYVQLRNDPQLQRKQVNFRATDLMITATALKHSPKFVTNNTTDLKKTSWD